MWKQWFCFFSLMLRFQCRKKKVQYILRTTYVSGGKFTHTHTHTHKKDGYICLLQTLLTKWLWKFMHFISSFQWNNSEENDQFLSQREAFTSSFIIISPYLSIKLCNFMVDNKILILFCRIILFLNNTSN